MSFWYVERERDKPREIVLSFTEDGLLETRANGALSWARLQGNYGYLALTRFSEFIDPAPSGFVHTDEQMRALNEHLDEALLELEGVTGLVVDVRDNEGGWDVAGRVVASRFAVEPVIVYEKRTRLGDGWTDPVVIEVAPSDGIPFDVPAVVLTGPGSVSAAETFVLAVREMPDVLTLGEATGGILSDALPKFLPSGIYFSVSNEEYRSVDGELFERVGVPPDEAIQIFPKSDRTNGRDSALERALELLDGR